MKKQIITTTLAIGLALSSFTGVFAAAKPTEVIKGGFEDFKHDLKKDISKEDMKILKTKFEKANKLEKDVEGYWNKLYDMDIFKDNMPKDMIDKDFGVEDGALDFTTENPMMDGIEFTFEDFAKSFKEDVKKDDLAKAKDLFEKAMAEEKKGEYGKADELFQAIDKLDVYDDFTEIPEDMVDSGFGVDDSIENPIMDGIELTFEDFAKSFKDNVKKEDLAKAKKLFDKAMEEDKKGEYDKGNELFEALDKLDLYNDYTEMPEEMVDPEFGVEDGAFDELTFEELAKDFKKDVKKEDVAKAKELFNKAIEGEKELNKIWTEIDSMNIYQEFDLRTQDKK